MCKIDCKTNRIKKLINFFFSNLIVRICVSVQWNKFPGFSTAYSTKCTRGVILEATAVSLLSFITAFPGALAHLTRDVCLHPCCCSQPHCSAGHGRPPPTLNPWTDTQIGPHSSFTFYSVLTLLPKKSFSGPRIPFFMKLVFKHCPWADEKLHTSAAILAVEYLGKVQL